MVVMYSVSRFFALRTSHFCFRISGLYASRFYDETPPQSPP